MCEVKAGNMPSGKQTAPRSDIKAANVAAAMARLGKVAICTYPDIVYTRWHKKERKTNEDLWLQVDEAKGRAA